ncbi:10995_t:CDS:10, partial [Gigaspora margarita]
TMEKYDPNNSCSLSYLLGFLEADNIKLLKMTIKEHYPGIYPNIDSNYKRVEKALQAEQNICLEKSGKTLSAEDTQALMVEYRKSKNQVYGLNQKIVCLQKCIAELENKLDKKMENTKVDLLEKSIRNVIESTQLGSTLLVSTKEYLSLVFVQPCPNCNNNSITNKEWDIISIGFRIKSTMECKKCNTIYEHTNEAQEISTMGITNHIWKNTYHQYQKMYSTPLIDDAKSSAVNALKKYIEYAKIQKKEELSVAFDCSWAHVWNASQANYFHKPIVAFHVVQKTRVAKDNKTGLINMLNPGNFEKSSRQMEHAILIEVLDQVTDKLENADLYLEVCIDGNLDSNKMLAYVPVVTKIFADLKHLMSNIRKAICHKNNSFQVFEDHIMQWFCRCIYSAALHAEANDPLAPNEGEIHKMQVDGLICHLQNDHTSCWSDVCWIKDDPTIILKEPTFSHSLQKRIDEFQKFLNTICRLLSGQRIATLSRTFQNEAFNWVKLVYLDKKIDYWQSYATQHTMAVLYYNEGYTYLLSTLREIYCGKPFESEDLIKIDTLVVMKTGGRKSFCYTASAILFHGLTIVISPLKSLIQSQMRTIEYESKLFEEMALGYTRLLFITLEKLLLSRYVKAICNRLNKEEKLQFNNVEALRDDLCIDQSHFAVVRENNLLHKELCFSVQCWTDKKSAWIDQIMSLIKDMRETKFRNDRNTKHKIRERITGSFGLGIDTPDVRLVIHYNFSSSINRLIQKSGWAGWNQESGQAVAQCVILYSGKDIHTNYAQVSQYYAWEGDPIPPICNLCDNCVRRGDDKVKQEDVLMDILDMLNVIKMLYENNDKPIIPKDIVDVFCCSNNARFYNKKLNLLDLDKCPKPSSLRTRLLAELALADLVHLKLVKQTILFKTKTNSAHFTCSVVIEGVVEDAIVLATAKIWLYCVERSIIRNYSKLFSTQGILPVDEDNNEDNDKDNNEDNNKGPAINNDDDLMKELYNNIEKLNFQTVMDLEKYINYSEKKIVTGIMSDQKILNQITYQDPEQAEDDKEDDSIEIPHITHKEVLDAINRIELYLLQQDLNNVT